MAVESLGYVADTGIANLIARGDPAIAQRVHPFGHSIFPALLLQSYSMVHIGMHTSIIAPSI
jgi:hypothetical protein